MEIGFQGKKNDIKFQLIMNILSEIIECQIITVYSVHK